MMKQFYAAIALLAIINSLATANEPSEIKMPDWFRRIQRSANIGGLQRQPSGRVDFTLASSYPSSNFLMYGTNCKFTGGATVKTFTGVADVLKCGSQYCAGNRKCSHFTFTPKADASTNECKLLDASSASPALGESTENELCGFIPIRACISKMESLPSLLACITLNSP